MSFNPIDLGALKKRRSAAVKGTLDDRLAQEKRGATKLDGRRLRAGKAKTVQLNVRIEESDKQFIFALADEKQMTIVEVMTEAIGLLRVKHKKG